MDVDDVRRRAATYDSLLEAGGALAYLLAVTITGAVLVDDPNSAAPIVSDVVGLALLAHAYTRDRIPELLSALLAALILLGWLFAATPALTLVDVAGSGAWGGDAAKPAVLSVALLGSYALVLAGVFPSVRRWWS